MLYKSGDGASSCFPRRSKRSRPTIRGAAHSTRSSALCRTIDRLADLGKHTRVNGHAPADIATRLSWAITHAVSNLQSIDANLFGRRYPMQTHERSKAEPLYAALLVVIEHVKRIETSILPY